MRAKKAKARDASTVVIEGRRERSLLKNGVEGSQAAVEHHVVFEVVDTEVRSGSSKGFQGKEPFAGRVPKALAMNAVEGGSSQRQGRTARIVPTRSAPRAQPAARSRFVRQRDRPERRATAGA